MCHPLVAGQYVGATSEIYLGDTKHATDMKYMKSRQMYFFLGATAEHHSAYYMEVGVSHFIYGVCRWSCANEIYVRTACRCTQLRE